VILKMKKLILLLLISYPMVAERVFAQEAGENKVQTGERHEFTIANFKTESGVVLPQARVVYGTYGKLNAAKDNAVLLPSHYMANFHGYEWLIGGRWTPRSCFLWRRNCLGTEILLRRVTPRNRFTGHAFL
jgi:hypothetical protein